MFSLKNSACAVMIAALAGCPDPTPPSPPERTVKDRNDFDGDDIPNAVDSDLDGDGFPNVADSDLDGDLVPNREDDDIDGDGTLNGDDTTPFGANPEGLDGPFADPDGDGQPNLDDPDDDDDGIPDGVFGQNDCNGDGIPEPEDADCDGFCIDIEGGVNVCDDGAPAGTGGSDDDGDGLPNPLDGDDDNDGIPDGEDGNPSGGDPCFAIEGPPDPGCILPPGEGEGEGEGEGGGEGEGEGEGGGGGEGEGEPTPGCRDDNFSPGDPIPPRVMLTVDRSGSMDSPADGFNGSKWDGAVATLDTVTHQLQSTIEMGLVLYPAGDSQNDQCRAGGIEERVQLNNADNITSALQSTGPGGGTPTAPTLLVAGVALTALGSNGGQRAVILVTDGGPNCNESLDGDSCRCVSSDAADCVGFAGNCLDDVNTIGVARQLNNLGFPTFVLTVPGAENFNDVLNNLAVAGGTGAFYETTSANDLAAALEDIAVRLGACRFDLPGSPRADGISVDIDGAEVGRDPQRQNGYDLVDANTIELCGTACDNANRATNVHVESCL